MAIRCDAEGMFASGVACESKAGCRGFCNSVLCIEPANGVGGMRSAISMTGSTQRMAGQV